MGSTFYEIGDIVRCDVHVYQSIKKGQTREVFGVERSASGNLLLKLENTMCQYGSSPYVAANFTVVKGARYKSEPKVEPKKETKKMAAYEKTKYLGVRIIPNDDGEFILYDEKTTPLQNARSDVLRDIREIMQPNEQWVILQLISKVELADPRPPVKITEYK